MEIYLNSIGHDHPQHKIDNQFFDSLDIGSSAEWVEERTGIQSRYSVLPQETLRALRLGETDAQTLIKAKAVTTIADLATKPWQQATSRFGETFPCDLLVCGTSIPDYDIPANASTIAAKLQLKATAFDINSACSSFVTDLEVTSSLLARGKYQRAAIFNVERYSVRLNYADKTSCVLFGDGAACTLLSTKPVGFRVVDTLVQSDASGFDTVVIPEGGLFWQNGARVQKFAIQKTCEATENILARNGLEIGNLSYFLGHQANLRMLVSAANKLGLAPEKHLYNVDKYGNQGAAGAPVVLSQNWDRFKKGDLVAIAVVGSGLTWGSALLEFV